MQNHLVLWLDIRRSCPLPAAFVTGSLYTALFVCVLGEWCQRGEGGAQAGGVLDPARGEPPGDEGCFRQPQARIRRSCSEEG